MTGRRGGRAARALRGAVVLTGIAAFAFPVFLMISGSLRPNAEMFAYAGRLSVFSFVPAAPTLDAYRRVFALPLFERQLLNTIGLGLFLATTTTATSTLAAYALARLRFRGRELIFLVMIATLMIPVDVVLPPLFFVVRDLGLIDTFWGLALPFVFSPIGVYLIRQAIQEVPIELDHAAALDGAGRWEVLRTAILPNIKSALLATFLMHFVIVWEWYLWALTALRSDDQQLAQVAIAGLIDPLRSSDYALVFAAAAVTVTPAFLVFALLQRFLVASTVSSAGK